MNKVDKEKLEYLKQLLPDSNELQLILSLNKTEELIKNYTNVSKIPKSVFYTHIEMAVLHYKYNEELNKPPTGGGESEQVGAIDSIQEGDTTVNFSSVSKMESTADKMKQKRIFEDKLLHDFRIPLHSIRKMRW